MIRVLFVFFSFFGHLLFSDEPHFFKGKHFLASYLECDVQALSNLDTLIQALDGAVASSGATVLNKASYVFPPDGLTVVYLLSESHASLHTYPEHGACFVDLFTCGDHCSTEQFDQALRDYLQPKQVSARFFHRGEEVEEIAFPSIR